MADGTAAQQNATDDLPLGWADAVLLVAEDKLTDATIARKVGIDRSTLHRWKKKPEFAASVASLEDELFERARRRGIARLDRRIDAANDRHERMNALIAARAKDMKGEIAGGETGLLVRQFKSVGNGPGARVVTEYVFDSALVRELREHEKQVAQDTGQWTEKRELAGADGGSLVIHLVERADGPQ